MKWKGFFGPRLLIQHPLSSDTLILVLNWHRDRLDFLHKIFIPHYIKIPSQCDRTSSLGEVFHKKKLFGDTSDQTNYPIMRRLLTRAITYLAEAPKSYFLVKNVFQFSIPSWELSV